MSCGNERQTKPRQTRKAGRVGETYKRHGKYHDNDGSNSGIDDSPRRLDVWEVPMSKEPDIDELGRLQEKATKGPFSRDMCGDIFSLTALSNDKEEIEAMGCVPQKTITTSAVWRGEDDPDAQYLVALLNAAPYLLECARRCRDSEFILNEIKSAREACDEDCVCGELIRIYEKVRAIGQPNKRS